ncbi:GATA transcription factor 8 [Hibiscus syriacus]|uniref:GATA transcription factor 8 n=1 Tax=Hibiscus syriacus TaxID=106335 RepID=A0A6A3ACQ1_HIBSY|nr:GATA transcription factor 8-like [Hibiscus syriacus]XP_039003519.1 GATA transcription factor 8-like [Hibiscus syriacus]KAE8701537.1 GATA transcription factor 8 [Hibiscus syriacus]
MIGSTDFIDEIDCGSFFNDLIDFPNGDVELEAFHSTAATDAALFPAIWTTQHESLPCSDSVFSHNSASDPSPELFVPYEDIVQLGWMSNLVEDSHHGASLMTKKEESSSIIEASYHQFRTCSPVSVLESNSSSTGAKTSLDSPETAAPRKRGRAQSKRPRLTTFNHLPVGQPISPTSSVNESDIPQPFAIPKEPLDSENYAESRLLIKLPKQVNLEHKKVKTKLSPSSSAAIADNSQNPARQVVRRCMHCEITKTPQWRAGPMGRKTLCNACGVRYKSDRLFPEYRPAASPTFVPSLHSNSHKKVVEMRTKSSSLAPTTTMSDNNPAELIPNKSNPALGYI